MKYYIIAGEASGDLHASKLMAGIRKRDRDAEFRCWGGEKMQAEGGTVVKDYHSLAFMGFIEVLFNLRTILANIRFCKKDLLLWNPDLLILVDYPGFNMRIAKFAKARGYRVVYYISPQVWAWKKGRVHTVHRDTDLAFVVLPFEKAFYANYGYQVEYVGHPLPDSVDLDSKPDEAKFRKANQIGDKPIVALLPGSRKQELKRMLPHMLRVADRFPGHQFVVAGVKSLGENFYNNACRGYNTTVVYNQTHNLLKLSKAALVTSGTATLEAGIIGTPQVVCYRMNFFTALVALVLVKVEFISLVNLILGRKSVTELIQYRFTTDNAAKELAVLLTDTPQRKKMLEDYAELRVRTGEPGASDRAVAVIFDRLKL